MPPVEIRGELTPDFGAALDKPENTQLTPEVRKGQVPVVRALLLAAVLAGATAVLYFTQLSGLKPVGGDRPALWLFVALGIWAAFAQPVAVRNRQSSFSTQLTEIPALVGSSSWRLGSCLSAISFGHLAASAQRRLQPTQGAHQLAGLLASVAPGSCSTTGPSARRLRPAPVAGS